MKVLLIDNNPEYALLVEAQCAEQKIKVNTLNAIETVHRVLPNVIYDYDALIIDFHLGAGTGIELVEWIRSEFTDKYIICLLYSADTSLCRRSKELVKRGADGFFLKDSRNHHSSIVDQLKIFQRIRNNKHKL